MWIAIIIIGVIVLLALLLLSGGSNQLYEVYDKDGSCVYMGNSKQCSNYMELRRTTGYRGRFKTKKVKSSLR